MYEAGTFVHAAVRCNPRKKMFRSAYLNNRLGARGQTQGGEIVVFPLWPKAGAPARRVLVRARKGVATPLRLAPGLVLHADDGTWTAAAAAVLRAGTALTL